MPRALLAGISVLTLIVALVAVGTTARATWSGSFTDVVNNSRETTPCHGGSYYFQAQFGWTRSCIGAHDIANSPVDVRVYVRGYVWTSATIVNAQSTPVFGDPNNCQTPVGYEWNNAWQVSVPPGLIGIAFHHLGNYHYAINSVVANGTQIGEQANWGQPVYYCNVLDAASTGPHTHTEAAAAGTNLSDSWRFGTSFPDYPFIRYDQP